MFAFSNYVFWKWNETFECLLKTEVDGDPQLLQPAFQEIGENKENWKATYAIVLDTLQKMKTNRCGTFCQLL